MQGLSPTSASYHNPTVAPNITLVERDAAYLSWREDVAVALLAAGYTKESELFRNCADPAHIFTVDYSADLPAGSIGVYVCEYDPHHHAKPIAPMCRLRICPDCAHQQTARLLNRYVPVLLDLEAADENDYSCKHIVLTTPISLDDPECGVKIRALMKAVPRCFDLVAGKKWREDSGLVFAFEFGEHGRKLHFHCIWYGKFIPQPCLSTAWNIVTDGLASVVHIEQIDRDGEKGRTLESAVAEVMKYATKLAKREPDGSWSYMPAAEVVKLFKVLKGLRRVRSYGLLYDIEEPKRPHLCPVCSGKMLRLAPIEWDIWRNTGWLPLEFQEAVNPSVFNLILGNNFSGLPPPENNVSMPVPVILPGFERFTGLAPYAEIVK